MSASSSDDLNLRAAVDALREAVAQIAELYDVLVVEFGGHRDTEGAVDGAIRILREQRAEIERLKRSMGLVQRADESHEAFKARVAVTNDKFDMRACMARSE